MATIIILQYKDGGEYKDIPLKHYTPVYFDDWRYSGEEGYIYNGSYVEIEMDVKSTITIDCLNITKPSESLGLHVNINCPIQFSEAQQNQVLKFEKSEIVIEAGTAIKQQ